MSWSVGNAIQQIRESRGLTQKGHSQPGPLPAVEMSLDEADGLVLAETVMARWDMPRADNSAMDGFAVTAAEAAGLLPIAGAAYAGHPLSVEVGAGRAVRITTGAPLPAGCDAVVPVKDTEEAAGGVRLKIVPQPGDHLRRQGEEYRQGELLVAAGTLLRAGSTAGSTNAFHPCEKHQGPSLNSG